MTAFVHQTYAANILLNNAPIECVLIENGALQDNNQLAHQFFVPQTSARQMTMPTPKFTNPTKKYRQYFQEGNLYFEFPREFNEQMLTPSPYFHSLEGQCLYYIA
jgi:hypothetical protein